MSLRDEVESSICKPGSKYRVGTILAGAGDDRDEIKSLVNDVTVPASALARVLQKHGHMVADHSITRHRRGDCNCGN
jgi:hypothetical protein